MWVMRAAQKIEEVLGTLKRFKPHFIFEYSSVRIPSQIIYFRLQTFSLQGPIHIGTFHSKWIEFARVF